MPDAIVLVVLAVVLGSYGLVVLARRARLRSAARALNGEYVDDGWSRPGRIEGDRFVIRISHVRRSFLTHVDVQPSAQVPGSYLLDAGFFEGWPDWNHVKVPALVEQRAFVVNVRFPGYASPTQDQRDALWRWLTRGGKDRRLSRNLLSAARVTRIEVSHEGLSTSFRGLVTDPTRLRRTLDALGQLAS